MRKWLCVHFRVCSIAVGARMPTPSFKRLSLNRTLLNSFVFSRNQEDYLFIHTIFIQLIPLPSNLKRQTFKFFISIDNDKILFTEVVNLIEINIFLVACTRLYISLYRSVGWSVGRSVGLLDGCVTLWFKGLFPASGRVRLEKEENETD